MSQITIPTSLNINLEFNQASFGKRFLAWLVDVIIFFCYLQIMDLITSPLNKKFNDTTANGHWLELIIVLPIAFYPLVCEYTMQGQTIGKKLLRIRVINEAGGNATLSQYMLRWLIRVGDFYLVIMLVLIAFLGPLAAMYAFMFGFVAVLAFIDFLCMVISKKGQRLGDFAAGTILIDTKAENVLHQTVFIDVEETYHVMYLQIMKLTDRDLNTIKNIHNNLLKKYDANLAYSTANKIQQVLKITTTQNPIDFIETVLKDYNYLSVR